MWRLGLVFVDISLHRRGPDVLPASQFLLGLVLVVYFLVGAATLPANEAPLVAFALLVADRVLYLGAAWAALTAIAKPRRFTQTAIALVGADVFLNLVSLPLLLWDDRTHAPLEQVTLPRLLIAIVYLWSIDVGGFIVARAMSRPYIVGLSVVVVYVLLSLALRDAILPTVS
ncbi:MAG TPA: hypothetical protein VFV10_14205 [Gammaproteobacteria bacterium]|nr:hypothetical protein [Gammaproteobacteria bacterium]